MACVVYILDGADLPSERLNDLRREIGNFARRCSALRCMHKMIIITQESTWSRLVSGQSVELSQLCESAIFVRPFTHIQSTQHIQALEAHYGVRVVTGSGLPGLPAITHMLAQQNRVADGENIDTARILGQYFRWQLSKADKASTVLDALVKLSVHLLDSAPESDPVAWAELDDAVAVGFVIRSTDEHGRESYAFADEWIYYYVVGFHLWKADRSTCESLLRLIEQASERVEYARALEWLSSVLGGNDAWREVSQRRPSHYLRCYRLATQFVRALSIESNSCLWIAPNRGYLSNPWCSIVSAQSGGVCWGTDPESDSADPPSTYVARPEFSMFSRKPLARAMVDDAAAMLHEVEMWLTYDRNRPRNRELWPAQRSVFDRLRDKLSFRNYDLTGVARSLEDPENRDGVQVLQEVFQEALRLTQRIADSEFHGIRDLMPRKIRFEVEALKGARELSWEYLFDSEEVGVEIIFGRHGEVHHWISENDEFREKRGVTCYGSASLSYLLDSPSYALSGSGLMWNRLRKNGELDQVNAVGSLAARWLAHGISSALSRGRSREPVVKSRILSWLDRHGVVDPPESEEFRAIESVLHSYRSQGRIHFWQKSDTGFIVDGFCSARPLRQGERAFRIDFYAQGVGRVKVVIRRVILRTTADPEPSEDDIDEHCLVVDREFVTDATHDLLDFIVGFPPSTPSNE